MTEHETAEQQRSAAIASGSPLGSTGTVLTVPNLISALRLLAAPVLVALLLGGHDLWAALLLALSSVSDRLDGWAARLLDQTSLVGEVLDDAADRLTTAAVVAGLLVRGVLPLWLGVIVLLADAFWAWGLSARRRGGATGGSSLRSVASTTTQAGLLALVVTDLVQGRWSAGPAVLGPLAWALTGWGAGLSCLVAALGPEELAPGHDRRGRADRPAEPRPTPPASATQDPEEHG